MSANHSLAAPVAPAITSSDVTLAGGVRLHYLQQGPRDDNAMILLHGYSDSSLSFTRVMPLLPPHLRVVAPDFRGHGDSDKPGRGYRIDELADDVINLMDALEVRSAVVIGHSMGSFVAQVVARRVPDRVSALVLVGSAPIARNTNMLELQREVHTLSDPIDDDFVRSFQYSTIAQPVPAAFMAAVIENSKRMPAAIWKAVINGLVEYREPSTFATDVPTMVTGGTRDSVFSVAEQTALAERIPGSRLMLFDEVGHTVHWERPEAFVRELMTFLK